MSIDPYQSAPNPLAIFDGDLGLALPVVAFRRIQDKSGEISYSWLSSAGESLFGKVAFLQSQPGVPSATHWADRDGLAQAIGRSGANLSISQERFRIVNPAGDVVWLQGAAKPERQADGGIVWLGLWCDVSEGKRALQRLDIILGHASDGIVLVDENGVIQMTNKALCDLFGYEEEELAGKPVHVLMDAKDGERHAAYMGRYLETGVARKLGHGTRELMGKRKDGSLFPFDLAISEVLSEGKRFFIGIGRDVTARKATEARLEFLAYRDPLTGLANRTTFRNGFEKALSGRKRDAAPLNLLSIGVDGFSFINSTLGHHIGDMVLKAIGMRLVALAGPDALVARIGGDRFFVLLSDVAPGRHLSDRVERIQRGMRESLTADEQEFELSASIGVSVWPRDGLAVDDLIRSAEAAHEQAKSQGPGNVHIFTKDLGEKSARALSLQSRIRRAIDNHEFVAYYQPQVDLKSGKIVGMEALVRWFTPEGPISPVEFIPVAEEFGLIDPISEAVVMAVCRQQREWRAKRINCVPVAVNISWRQFRNPRKLLSTLDEALRTTGIEPSLLEIELTESSAMQDIQQAIATIRLLKERGLNCAIDDFGTGYSSLSALKRFPISKLKVDRSFVIDLDKDANDAAIVSAIIAMAHALKLKVVAEGVETESHLKYLRDLGCDTLQGYLFSPPVAPERIEGFLKEGKRLEG